MKAIFPGTFDPPTLGHLDLIKRAAVLFDPLVVAVGQNIAKTCFFSVEERLEMLQAITKSLPQVQVVYFPGLLVDFVRQHHISLIVRSIRSISDFDREIAQARINGKLTDVETLFFPPAEEFEVISSTLIKEIAHFGKRLNLFVPEEIEARVFERLFIT